MNIIRQNQLLDKLGVKFYHNILWYYFDNNKSDNSNYLLLLF